MNVSVDSMNDGKDRGAVLCWTMKVYQCTLHQGTTDQWPLHCMVLPLVLVPAQLSSSVQIAPLQTAVRCLWAVICHPHDRNIECVEILVLSLPLIHDIFSGVRLGLFQWGETWMMVLWVTHKVLRCDGRNNQFVNLSVRIKDLSSSRCYHESNDFGFL